MSKINNIHKEMPVIYMYKKKTLSYTNKKERGKNMFGIPLIEWVGYAASTFIDISLIMNSVTKIRIINTIGCILFVIYGLNVGSYPVAFSNSLIIIINLVYLFKDRDKNKKQRKVDFKSTFFMFIGKNVFVKKTQVFHNNVQRDNRNQYKVVGGIEGFTMKISISKLVRITNNKRIIKFYR